MKNQTVIASLLLIFLSSITLQQKIEFSKFNLKLIQIENNFLLSNDEIEKLLIKFYNKNLLFLNYKEVENQLKKNTFIESFNVKKKYPDTLKIEIFEKKPIAILLNNKNRFYLSNKIDLIEYNDHLNYENLPYVFGSQKEFKIFYNNLKKINFPFDLVKKYTLYQSNRWDLETVNKKTIKLPSNNYLKSLDNFLNLNKKMDFRGYSVFDYRIENQLILK